MTSDGAEMCELCEEFTGATWKIVFLEGRNLRPQITFVCDEHKIEYVWRSTLANNSPGHVHIVTLERLAIPRMRS